MADPKLEVWAGASICQIRDISQSDAPLVCQVLKGPTETMQDTAERARMLAELIQIGFLQRYGSEETRGEGQNEQ